MEFARILIILMGTDFKKDAHSMKIFNKNN
jgi:hypothetical protein